MFLRRYEQHKKTNELYLIDEINGKRLTNLHNKPAQAFCRQLLQSSLSCVEFYQPGPGQAGAALCSPEFQLQQAACSPEI